MDEDGFLESAYEDRYFLFDEDEGGYPSEEYYSDESDREFFGEFD